MTKFTEEELNDFAASTEVWNNPDVNDQRWEPTSTDNPLPPGRFNLQGQKYDPEVTDQMERVADLHRRWNSACAAFDRDENRDTFRAMNTAMEALRDAEETLIDIRRYSHLYQPVNVREFDAELEDSLDAKDARRN